jgi:uncharacterized protein
LVTEPGARDPLPIRQFIIKIHGRCNLSCDYCYVYTMRDQSWRTRPRVMSDATIARTATRVAQHLRTHRIGTAEIVLHGGEPLLAGADRLTRLLSEIHGQVDRGTTLRFAVQTNAVLLDTDFLNLFRDWDVRVSVSLDGTPADHDRHRRRADGGGSYASVARALRRLTEPGYRHLFSGLLATIDLSNDPLATYHALVAHEPPAIDFLLPHGNWSQPPPGRDPDSLRTPYADWLIAIFEHWYAAPRRPTRIRSFEEILHLLLGGASRVEGLGRTPAASAVVQTDGDIEESDMLTSAYPGAAGTGLNVHRHDFDDLLRWRRRRAERGADPAKLCATCAGCRLREVCGAGLLPHRYRAGTGFANPSVYCPDLYRLITHVRTRLNTDLDRLR